MTSDVSNESSAYRAMKPHWALVRALLGGTEAMRAAGTTYLPRHTRESEDAYAERLRRSFHFNYFESALGTLSEMPFTKPVTLADSAPEELHALVDDVDKQGNDVTTWARNAFADGLANGLVHVLVDFPRVDRTQVQTRADEEEAGVRPYFVHVPADSLLAAYATVEGGAQVLTHVRIRETVTRVSGFEEVAVERVRVLEREKWEVYEKEGKGAWALVDGGENTLGVIPLVTWYAGKPKGFMLIRPPLLSLAEKNLEHWQSSSDQRNILTITRFPILAASGVTDESPRGGGAELEGLDSEDREFLGKAGGRGGIAIGPHSLLTTSNPQGKFYYVEHAGAAIEAGAKDLERLEDQMAALSVELLVRRKSNTTATEKSINAGQSYSKLGAMARTFGDALELAFHFAARWMALEVPDDKLKVSVHTDFGVEEGDAQGLEVLFKTRAAGDISRRAFLKELQRRGTLSADFDEDLDADYLAEEGPRLGTVGRQPLDVPHPPQPGQGAQDAGAEPPVEGEPAAPAGGAS
ncbi:DUF4055 domain-containing protein [Myxococcus sp. AS-1-15]|uniref:DUF4055 domain-containing protein n=1 Tax=Myxococcus sp. AS-1-15 TaxID=2874600 RepID=UPI001CBBBDBA|nr:DUF4055 domain-containing protein [Myxococcus sp. AS-1-15]MBZ4402495.1 DUF4055 domain-containing protein [Myxococcus sp. AS-1-15]